MILTMVVLNRPSLLAFFGDAVQYRLALVEDLAEEPHPSPLLRGEGACSLAHWERVRVRVL